MQQIRTKLTRLKTKFSETITEEIDIFRYAGVNKPDILNYIDQAYGLVERLEGLRGSFPLIALKRKVMPELEHCSNLLDEIRTSGEGAKLFDGFLNSLTKIHDEIYLTHVVHCSDGLNVESSVGQAQSKLSQLEETLETLRPEVSEFKTLVEELQKNVEDAKATGGNLEAMLADAQVKNDQITRSKEQASASSSAIAKFETDAKEQRGTISSLASQASTAEKKLQKLIAEATNQSKVIEETLSAARATKDQNEQHQRAIADTLRLASKYGMAASFKERKEELVWPLLFWSAIFAGSIIGLCWVAIEYIVPHIQSKNLPTLPEILVKLSLISPLVWLGWMAAKQYGYTSRIREDYSFKYASALAFEGYKKEAAEIDQTVLKELLRVATLNMTLNPLRIFANDSNQASPLHELTERFFSRKNQSPPTASSTPAPAAPPSEESAAR